MAFNTQKELERALLGVLKEAMNEIAIKVRNRLQENLMTDWYMRQDAPLEGVYERTYELYQSIEAEPVKNKKGGIETHIFFNLNNIKSYTYSSGFNAHASLNGKTSYQGTPIKAWLIEWIENGIEERPGANYTGNQPIIEGAHMLLRTSEWLDKNLNNIIQSTFREYGINIKRVF